MNLITSVETNKEDAIHSLEIKTNTSKNNSRVDQIHHLVKIALQLKMVKN